MSDEIELDGRTFNAALAVLEREQKAHQPTRIQLWLYRAFNIASVVLALFMSFYIAVIASDNMGKLTDTGAFLPLAAVFGVVLVGTLLLFLCNVGLIRKLFRHARMRRRLGMNAYMNAAFRARRKRSRFKNVATAFIAAGGAILSLLALASIVLFFAIFGVGSDPVRVLILVLNLFVWALFGISFVSLHYVRRAKERYDVVSEGLMALRALAKKASAQASAAGSSGLPGIPVTPDLYDFLARLERQQVILQRAESIDAGRHDRSSTDYSFQSSRQLQEAKSRLQSDELADVEDLIQRVLADPLSSDADVDPHTGIRIARVSDKHLMLQYDVNPERKLVRLHDLARSDLRGE